MTVTNGLIAHFLFEQNVNDETGTHTASFNGTPAYVPGYEGSYAGNFTGSSSWVDVASPYIGLPAEWSISTWFQLPSGIVGNGDWNTLVRGSSDHHQVIIERNTGELGGYDNGGGQFRGTGHFMSQYEDGNWHHLVVTGSGTSQQFYIDNISVGSIDRNLNSNIRSIGGHWGNGQPWGYLDDFRVYNRNLTIEEVNTLYVGYLPEGAKATGGNVTAIEINGVSYIVHTFTESGTFKVLEDNLEVEYLVVGGGGAGGCDDEGAGGGGAGGFVEGNFSTSSGSYTVTVGNGGAGRGSPTAGLNGEDSSVFTITAIGGGGGGGHETDHNNPAKDGGSGGGGASQDSSVTSGALGGKALQPGSTSGGFGNDGGNTTFSDTDSGAGGGGAGTAGQNQTSGSPGDGGDGKISEITGSAVYYAGGGGGSWRNSDPEGVGGLGGGGDGSDGTGGVGAAGKGSGGGAGGSVGGDGGSGVVIIRYALQKVDGLTVSSSELISGDTFTATLTVVDAADNTTVPYTITGVDSSDIDNFPLTGNFTITDEQGDISFTATPDGKKTLSIESNGFTQTVDLVENIYGLSLSVAQSNETFTSAVHPGIIDLSNVDYALDINILTIDNLYEFVKIIEESVTTTDKNFVSTDFVSITNFNVPEPEPITFRERWAG